MTLLLAYFFLALFLSFLCSLLEAVLLSTPASYSSILAKQNSTHGERLERFKDNINRPLAAILTVNTIANTIGAVGVGAKTQLIYGNEWVTIASGILTLSILIFSEIIPKTIGAVYNKSLAAFAAISIKVLMFIAWPFVIISETISKYIHNDQTNPTMKASREELLAMAEISEDEGSIDEQEGDIIENLMKLDDMKVEEIMTPRSVMFALQEKETVGSVIEKHSPIAFSRIPVFNKDLDNITGIVNRYTLVDKQGQDDFNVKMNQMMKSIHSINETTSVADALDLFVRRRQQMFIVTEEFGTTTGLITLEDAIETLLGVEIVDEHDNVVDMRKLAKAKMKLKNKV